MVSRNRDSPSLILSIIGCSIGLISVILTCIGVTLPTWYTGINANNDAAIYFDFDAPIYQISIDNFYRLRAAAALSIVSILFIFFSIIFGLITGIILMNIYIVFIAPILACMAVIFGICCLVVA